MGILQQRVSPELRKAAKENRAHLTEAECALWQCLRRGNLGLKFRRQQVIGRFIVDFYSHEAGLVIEIDGKYHEEAEQATTDVERQRFLMDSGLQILRFSNDQVLTDLASVLTKIEEACSKT